MSDNLKKRVAVAMSGGVDSSAAALILKREGYDVIGVSMKLWEGVSAGKGRCCSLDDFRDARRVADILEIPYYVVNMQEEFKNRVVNNFVENYLAASTPNPCIMCNQEMKFDLLLKKASELGANTLATGHYARIEYDKNRARFLLKKGINRAKDQSYFLFSMTQEQLSRVLFPLGGYENKDDVRTLLREAGIQIAEKEESQDICFVDDHGYAAFIEEHMKDRSVKKGKILSPDGKVLGDHEGIHKFTIGQRRGLGIASNKRKYVVGFDHDSHDVILGDEEGLMSKGLIAKNINWISMDDLKEKCRASVKIRYSENEHACCLSPVDDGNILVEFDKPQRAVTPGQAVVFYKGTEVLGGGWIERAIK